MRLLTGSEEDQIRQNELFKLIDVIENVELYHSWVDPITVLNVTKKRYTRLLDMQAVFKLYVFKKRQNNVLKSLSLHKVNYSDKVVEEVWKYIHDFFRELFFFVKL